MLEKMAVGVVAVAAWSSLVVVTCGGGCLVESSWWWCGANWLVIKWCCEYGKHTLSGLLLLSSFEVNCETVGRLVFLSRSLLR